MCWPASMSYADMSSKKPEFSLSTKGFYELWKNKETSRERMFREKNMIKKKSKAKTLRRVPKIIKFWGSGCSYNISQK